MATTTYALEQIGSPSFINKPHTNGDVFGLAVAGNAAGNAFLGVWDDDFNGYIRSRLVGSDGVLAGDHANQYFVFDEPSVVALSDGRFVLSSTDGTNAGNKQVKVALLDADGVSETSVTIAVTAHSEYQSDVAALAGPDGGFVVSWTDYDAVGNDFDIWMAVRNADGSPRGNAVLVCGNNDQATGSSVAGLAGGGFVVAWRQFDMGGSEVRFRRYDPAGNALDVGPTEGVLIDSTGSVNEDIQVLGLPDGGFVVAYTDNGWGSGTDITARIYNANGTPRTSYLQINSVANGGVTVGDQDKPTLAVLSDGFFAVGWQNGSSTVVQVYDAMGQKVAGSVQNAHSVEAELAGLANGRLGLIWETNVADTDGVEGGVRSTVLELVRTTDGDGTNETLTGDSLKDIIHANGGNDVLKGGGGADELHGGEGFDFVSYVFAPTGVVANLANPAVNTGDAKGDTYDSIEGLVGSNFNDSLTGNGLDNTLDGGEGDDALDGGAGNDTAVFTHKLGSHTIKDFGTKIVVSGPDGTDTLTGIEYLKFADRTITPADFVNDGDQLFDTLYYLSSNADVLQAGINAHDHYNSFGMHEGRDPNAYFDTSGYLAVNKDIATAGWNPLEHYRQYGWAEGRDPSAAFDTTLYLLRNPDVAAVGWNPLEHFLQYGYAEGRQAYQAIGQNIVGGFDAQYYLFHNPDIAAAGVDPLAHFNQFGWHEGRNPNAFFDTAGYLSHYGDVAAAGVNPLDHYLQFGWKEFRDPSASFDTIGYFIKNLDVWAAGVNPVEHYLTFGIYEGRSIVDDGMWR
jgi:hypothetical protein